MLMILPSDQIDNLYINSNEYGYQIPLLKILYQVLWTSITDNKMAMHSHEKVVTDVQFARQTRVFIMSHVFIRKSMWCVSLKSKLSKADILWGVKEAHKHVLELWFVAGKFKLQLQFHAMNYEVYFGHARQTQNTTSSFP